MDWQAFRLSLFLACLTAIILIPMGILLAHYLVRRSSWLKQFLEASLTLPLVLPPTVLGYYLLVGFGNTGFLGSWFYELTGNSIVFSFFGILIASLIVNIPFAFIPIQRAFEAIPIELRDAAATCGLNPLKRLWKIELPLAWKGICSATVMTIAHTIGEFGVVLMVGGNIPGQTRTLSIAIYDRVQALDMDSAGVMSFCLLLFSFVTLLLSQILNRKSVVRGVSH